MSWVAFVHVYVTWEVVEQMRSQQGSLKSGNSIIAYAKDSIHRPADAIIELSFPEHVVESFDVSTGTYNIRPRNQW